ncbi:MAG: hypothetical protein JST39_24990, partial [Bacteroidetes bacterium]|nr:hypothetical protein [Bacteroidota bacterium]
TNYLYIVYKKDREAPGYLDYIHESRPAYFQRSAAFLPDAIPIGIEPTGNYYPPQSFMTEGYWAWDEKMGNLLPIDYKR